MKSDFNEKIITVSAYVLICVFFFLMLLGIFLNLNDFSGFFSYLADILKPITYGLIVALIVTPLVGFYEAKAFRFIFPSKPKSKLRRGCAIVAAYLSVLLIIATVLLFVIPQLIDSYNFFQPRLANYLTSALDWLEENLPYADVFAEQYHNMTEYFRTSVLSSLTSIDTQLPAIVAAFNRVISETWDSVLGMIVSIYLITSRRMLMAILRKVMTALFSQAARDRIYIVAGRLYRNFIDYTTGRLLYTLINTAVFLVAMWVFRLPYYSIVACIIGIAGLVPVVGPLLGTLLAAFLIFITAPSRSMWYILLMLTLHLVCFAYIQPRIIKARVRRSVGVTLMAVLIMGALFGIVGLLAAVPVYVTIEETIKSKIDVMLYKKSLKKSESSKTTQ